MNLSNPLIEIRYEGKQPTVNHMYASPRGGFKYLKPEGRRFKDHVTKLARDAVAELYGDHGVPEYGWYVIHLIFGIQLYYKNGNKRRWDVSDRIKLPEDAFAEGVGIDDKAYRRVIADKEDIPHDAEPYTIIRFYGVKGENDD